MIADEIVDLVADGTLLLNSISHSALLSFFAAALKLIKHGYRFEGRRTPHGAQELHEGCQDQESLQPSVDQALQVLVSQN